MLKERPKSKRYSISPSWAEISPSTRAGGGLGTYAIAWWRLTTVLNVDVDVSDTREHRNEGKKSCEIGWNFITTIGGRRLEESSSYYCAPTPRQRNLSTTKYYRHHNSECLGYFLANYFGWENVCDLICRRCRVLFINPWKVSKNSSWHSPSNILSPTDFVWIVRVVCELVEETKYFFFEKCKLFFSFSVYLFNIFFHTVVAFSLFGINLLFST